MWDLNALLLTGVLALPLEQPDGWQLLEYNRLPPNRVEFTEQGMRVHVDRSASPIIYPLPAPRQVKRISISGRLDGLLDVEPRLQGQQGEDDFSLKLGLVVSGDKTLNFLQRLVSADWVRRLHDIAPEGSGIDRVLFLNAVQSEPLLGQTRRHPLSSLLHERYVWLIDRSGPFRLDYELDQATEVVAVWLSIDGDDSQSRYSMLIEDLRLHGESVEVGQNPDRLSGGAADMAAGG